jgi:S1-C subfamily serine protease
MGHGEHDDEPLDEGRDEDDASRGAPPDPLDRLWVHPTELPPLASGFVPGTSTPGSAVRRPRAWMLPILGGAAGALVTVAALSIAGVFDRSTSPADQQGGLAGGVRVTSTAPSGALTTGLSIVAVVVHDNRETRRGSGVCVRHAGGVLTSARLVGDAKTVDVLTSDGETHPAIVRGRDHTTDLVLLAVDGAATVPAARLADDTPAAGSPVWVLGARPPGSTEPWQSNGLLSSNNAILSVAGGPTMSGLLETDASAGNAAAGGALIDQDGAVAGIVLSRVGTSGTTFAMPIARAVAIAEQLDERGHATHGSAGVELTDKMSGPTITKMLADSPAARAGAKVGDVVMSIDGRPVETINDVAALVRAGEPGRTVTFELRRGKVELKVPVQLAAMTG